MFGRVHSGSSDFLPHLFTVAFTFWSLPTAWLSCDKARGTLLQPVTLKLNPLFLLLDAL